MPSHGLLGRLWVEYTEYTGLTENEVPPNLFLEGYIGYLASWWLNQPSLKLGLTSKWVPSSPRFGMKMPKNM